MVWSWFRLDLRRRWRSLLVLAVLVAFASGVVMTAVAGARRGATAVDRLVERTLPATIQLIPDDQALDWDTVRAMSGVEAVAEAVLTAYELEGVPLQDFVAADAEVFTTIERPVVLAGRLADPTRPDEAMVTAGFVALTGKEVGDTVTVRLYQPETLALAMYDPEVRADGPIVETTIVGVVRSPLFSDDLEYATGTVIPSAGLFATYPENLLGGPGAGIGSALVRLDRGRAAVADFQSDLARVTGRSDINVWDHAASMEYIQGIVRFESNALLAFATATALTAIVVLGQAIARHAAAPATDLGVLSALGMTPAQTRRATTAGPLLAAVVGATVGGIVAISVSPRFPIGSAALIEPTPGVHANWLLLAGCWVTVVLLVAGAAVIGSPVAAASSTRPPASPRRSSLAAKAAGAGMPVPVVVGVGLALDPGAGSDALPVRPALIGAVVAVAGIVGALTLSAGIDDATRIPARYGQVHQLEAAWGEEGVDGASVDEALALIAGHPQVAAVNDSRVEVATAAGVAATIYAIDPVGDEALDIVVTRGTPPSSPGDVAIAPFTATSMGVGIGDTIEMAGTASTRQLVVSGLAFVPEGPENYYSTGAWVNRTTYDSLFVGFTARTAHIALQPGADPSEVRVALQAEVSTLDGPSPTVLPALQRDHSAEIRGMRRLPTLLAGFLALLGLGALGHAMGVALRRRRRTLATLRVVGMTPRQSRTVIATQASVLALIGLAIGVPLGVALGRTLWRYVADSTLVHYVPPMAWRPLSLMIVATLLATLLLAAWPSHRVASMPLHEALRAE